MNLNIAEVKPLVELALREDIGTGDITSDVLIAPGREANAVIIAGERGVIAGLSVSELVFNLMDSEIVFKVCVSDGDKVEKGKIVARVSGRARAVLAGERTALNFLSRLSGIATKTARFVERVGSYRAKVMDTRKTTPGWRILEKYAVRVGGGHNHRMGLYDAVLIKDNHLKLVEGRIGKAVAEAKKAHPSKRIEVETTNISEVKDALSGNPDIIMLDNMSPVEVREAVEVVRKSGGGVQVEVSGGVTLENVEEFAAAGADIISVGALTHSVRSLDFSMELDDLSDAQ
jgi:nicotinate-nucleotide pyrophosphorylase (carboxylating)